MMRPKARIGMVNFINTAPLYEVWRETVVRPDWRVTEGSPAELNRLLYANKLDLGFASSHEYAQHPHDYRIMTDLSISAKGPVGSVFLFSSIPVRELDGHLLQLSSQSQTSVSLVRIVLEEFYGLKPVYLPGERRAEDRSVIGAPAAVLAIGDEALRLAGAGHYPYRLDLGEAWQRETGLPFVFAVWAVREDFCRREPDLVVEIHEELRRCLRQGRKRLKEISAAVAGRIPMSVTACYEYLKGIEYDLGPEKQAALEKFFAYLIRRGEAPKAALPLRLCGSW